MKTKGNYALPKLFLPHYIGILKKSNRGPKKFLQPQNF